MNIIKNPKNEAARKKFKIIGPIVLGVGIIFFLIAIINFFSCFGTGNFPNLFILAFFGLPLIGVGAVICRLGYMKQITGYVASQTTPVTSDSINYIIDNNKEAIKNVINNKKITCPYCNTLNDEGAKFCDNCGKELNKVCPNCNTLNDPNAKYCDNCGHRF